MTTLLDVIAIIVAFAPTGLFVHYCVPIILAIDVKKMESLAGQAVAGATLNGMAMLVLWAVVFLPTDTHVTVKFVLALAGIVAVGFLVSNEERGKKQVAAFCKNYPKSAKEMIEDSKIPVESDEAVGAI